MIECTLWSRLAFGAASRTNPVGHRETPGLILLSSFSFGQQQQRTCVAAASEYFMKSQSACLALVFVLVLLLVPGISHAQTPTSCSITVFQAPPSGDPGSTFVNGVNRWGNAA